MLQRRAPAAGVAPARSRLAAPRRGPSSLVPAAQGGSFDNEGELDYGLSRELESLTARDKFAKLSKHLELLYQASKPEAERKVEQCQPCRGSGEHECDWCHGTGAMTIGDVLYCSEGGCIPCPVCSGKGLCKCEHCRGTGKRASWLPLAPKE